MFSCAALISHSISKTGRVIAAATGATVDVLHEDVDTYSRPPTGTCPSPPPIDSISHSSGCSM